MNNHINKLYMYYIKESDGLKLLRYVFAFLLILGVYWLYKDSIGRGILSIFVSMAFGEYVYKPQLIANRVNNKETILNYLRSNGLYTINQLKILSNQFKARSNEIRFDSTKISALLAALLAPYYLKVIDLGYTDLKSLIYEIPGILISVIILCALILNGQRILDLFFWFLNKKQRVYKDISWFIIEEIVLDKNIEESSTLSVS